ncbi:hypothetical protein [uncultured Thiodictyon sp.]|uniref:hypothetical protein n=1 Tax=uncultured Thiodictyon sp. TaxID=1846217 RepID=UPI00260070CD|nr:hypothetical protein [uncultured Thiodictyon sp.]
MASVSVVPAVLKDGAQRMAAPVSRTTDISLYRSLVAQVRAGSDYYVVATSMQRELGYPIRPFFTVRPPTLTWLIAALSPLGAQLFILLLVAATVIAWTVRLTHSIDSSPVRMMAGILLILLGVMPATSEPLLWFTDVWAGLLIALSLALHSPNRWWPSVAAGLAAILIRELALPYLLAMGIIAALSGQRREAVGWGIAVGVFAVAFIGHAQAVHALIQAADPVSQGWSGRGGWGMFVASCWQLTTFTMLPAMAVAVLLPLSFFGLAAWNASVALRAFLTLSGYTLLIALFARRDNGYWVWLVSPLLGLGLLFLPSAVADLVRSILSRSGAAVLRAEGIGRAPHHE